MGEKNLNINDLIIERLYKKTGSSKTVATMLDCCETTILKRLRHKGIELKRGRHSSKNDNYEAFGFSSEKIRKILNLVPNKNILTPIGICKIHRVYPYIVIVIDSNNRKISYNIPTLWVCYNSNLLGEDILDLEYKVKF